MEFGALLVFRVWYGLGFRGWYDFARDLFFGDFDSARRPCAGSGTRRIRKGPDRSDLESTMALRLRLGRVSMSPKMGA